MLERNCYIVNGWKAGIIMLFMFILTACSDDGGDGRAGVSGSNNVTITAELDGPLVISQTQTSLIATINSVAINSGPPVVNFSVVDQDGAAYIDLNGFRFTLAKLDSRVYSNDRGFRS